MITFFTTTKPFDGQMEMIQRNALRSWRALAPECQIIVFGDEPGTEKYAREVDAVHIPDVECTSQGTPLLSDMFHRAQESAEFDIICFVNADIIFLPDFVRAVESHFSENMFVVGQRWDVLIDREIYFDSPRYATDLRELALKEGRLHRPTGMDYFIFRRWGCPRMKKLVVGRAGWDRWFMQAALEQGMTVVDATQAITCIHQAHDYSHMKNGKHGSWFGEEAQKNQMIADLWEPPPSIADAKHVLPRRGPLRPARQAKHGWRRMERMVSNFPPVYSIYRFLRRAALALGIRGARVYRSIFGINTTPVNDSWKF